MFCVSVPAHLPKTLGFVTSRPYRWPLASDCFQDKVLQAKAVWVCPYWPGASSLTPTEHLPAPVLCSRRNPSQSHCPLRVPSAHQGDFGLLPLYGHFRDLRCLRPHSLILPSFSQWFLVTQDRPAPWFHGCTFQTTQILPFLKPCFVHKLPYLRKAARTSPSSRLTAPSFPTALLTLSQVESLLGLESNDTTRVRLANHRVCGLQQIKEDPQVSVSLSIK